MELKDRINAVIRTPKYINAYNEYRRSEMPTPLVLSGSEIHLWPLSPAADRLCIKFKIPYPFYPYSIVPDEFPAIIPKAKMEKGKCLVGPEHDLCLHVKIDMTQTLTKIIKEINILHKKFSIKVRSAETKRKRNRSSKALNYGIWDIYNMVKRDRLTKYAVAKKLGMDGIPSLEAKSHQIYRNVQDAYSKAEKMISDVKKGLI